ncbi:MAG: glycine cleavage system protein GcvH [Nitrososphaerota archaeon]|nr:glycine cleavage system protein GcvH [Nitrososphaerota archaeon]
MSEKETYESPEGYYYTRDHEWIRITGATALVGITDYAAKMLNDIVYVNLPQVGAVQKAKDVFGQVESVKTVSDMYMPLSGKVLKVNSRLAQTPELVSNAPYTEGWMLEVEPTNLELEKEQLLDAKSYKQYIETLKE